MSNNTMLVPYLPVIIGESFNAYGIIRSFYDKGIKPISVITSNLCFFKRSRYIAKQVRVTDPNIDCELFVKDLIELGKDIVPNKGIIFPTHDVQLIAISKNENLLNEYFVLPFSNYETINRVTNKAAFSELCKGVGVPTTREIIVNNEANALSIDVGYPRIIKNVQDSTEAGKITKRVSNATEYESFIHNVYKRDSNSKLLIQEFIEDSEKLMPTVNGVGDGKGNCLCLFFAEKVRQFPPETGLSTSYRTFNPDGSEAEEIIEYTKRIIQKLRFLGLFGIEYKYNSKTGKYYVIEMNARSEYPNYLQLVSGLNMPYILTSYYIGKETLLDVRQTNYDTMCIVPFSDWFDSVVLNKKMYPQYALTMAARKRTMGKTITKYGLTQADITSYICAYLVEYRKAVIHLFRYINKIPTGVSTKNYIKGCLTRKH